MAKILLLFLVAITLTAEVAPDSVELTSARDAQEAKLKRAFDGVMAAAPPGKDSEAAKEAVAEQQLQILAAVTLAEKTGGKEKVVSLTSSYEKAADQVIAAPPADKLKVMKKAFTPVTDAA